MDSVPLLSDFRIPRGLLLTPVVTLAAWLAVAGEPQAQQIREATGMKGGLGGKIPVELCMGGRRRIGRQVT